jgi:hypothetical protein
VTADKGHVTVVLNASDCTEKVLALLDDPTYKRIPHSPLNKKLLPSLRGPHFLKMSLNYNHEAQGHPDCTGSHIQTQ